MSTFIWSTRRGGYSNGDPIKFPGGNESCHAVPRYQLRQSGQTAVRSNDENSGSSVALPLAGSISVRNLAVAASLLAGVVGVILTIVSIIVTLQEPEPGVTFKAVGETNVLDVHRPLEDLTISFRGRDVEQQNLNLQIFTINVENSGETDILQAHYDEDGEWGITFSEGEVIEARLIEANVAHLETSVIPQVSGRNSVALPKLIFDEGDAFTIEILLLHPQDTEPTWVPIGKIAGIKRFYVVEQLLSGTESGFFARAFAGDLGVLFVRSVVYFLGSIIALIVGLIAVFAITECLGKCRAWRRRRRATQSDAIRQIEQVRVRDGLVALYATSGINGIRRTNELIEEPGNVRWSESLGRWIPTVDRARENDHLATGIAEPLLYGRLLLSAELDHLTEMGVLTRGENDEAVVTPEFLQAVRDLLAELDG